MSSAAPMIGIDFGTSKSAMAWYDPQKQADTIYSDGREEVPSIVYIGPTRGDIRDIRVGLSADRLLNDIANNPGARGTMLDLSRFFISVKRNLVNEALRRLDGVEYTPKFVVSQILGKLKNDAEEDHFKRHPDPAARFTHLLSRAVITHPASFGDTEKGKIKEAAELAGFSAVAFLPEPVAAAIAFAQAGIEIGKCVLVYDFGAGTFDAAALLRESETSFIPVVPSKGSTTQDDDPLGGDILDEILYDYLDAIAQREKGLSFNVNGRLDVAIKRLCRQSKESLSLSRLHQPHTFRAYIRVPDYPVLFEHEIDYDTFNSLVSPMVEETVRFTREVMDDAERAGYPVETVLLVGGSSKLPLVKTLLHERLKIEPQGWHKQHIAVALGAASYASQLWGNDFEEYRQAVSKAWVPNRSLTQEQVQGLQSLASSKQLTDNEAANIEEVVIGSTKEAIVQRKYQAACSTYRDELRSIQQSGVFTQSQFDALVAKEKELGISKIDAEAFETEILGETKEEYWGLSRQKALAEYRSSVAEFAQGRNPIWEQVKALDKKAKELDLSEEDADTIEREILQDTKEMFLKRLEYRDAVRTAWQMKVLTPTRYNMLMAKRKELDFSDKDAEPLEKEEMDDTALNLYNRNTQDAREKYRALVQAAKANVDVLNQEATTLELSQEDITTIHREVMPSLLPPVAPVGADKSGTLFTIIFFVVISVLFAALAGGFIGSTVGYNSAYVTGYNTGYNDASPSASPSNPSPNTPVLIGPAVIFSSAAILSLIGLFLNLKPRKRSAQGDSAPQSSATQHPTPQQHQRPPP